MHLTFGIYIVSSNRHAITCLYNFFFNYLFLIYLSLFDYRNPTKERLVEMLVLGLKDVDFIGRLKNEYHALTVVSQLVRLLDVALCILEGTM